MKKFNSLSDFSSYKSDLKSKKEYLEKAINSTSKNPLVYWEDIFSGSLREECKEECLMFLKQWCKSKLEATILEIQQTSELEEKLLKLLNPKDIY